MLFLPPVLGTQIGAWASLIAMVPTKKRQHQGHRVDRRSFVFHLPDSKIVVAGVGRNSNRGPGCGPIDDSISNRYRSSHRQHTRPDVSLAFGGIDRTCSVE